MNQREMVPAVLADVALKAPPNQLMTTGKEMHISAEERRTKKLESVCVIVCVHVYTNICLCVSLGWFWKQEGLLKLVPGRLVPTVI